MRIGEAAEQAGVSCRTLRYYEELGLLAPSEHSAGGARRYSPEDLARLVRIRELQELLGFDLNEIGEILRGEDTLADIRTKYRDAATAERQRMLADATAINDRLRAMVRAKQDRLAEMMRTLEEKARRYRRIRGELTAEAEAEAEGGAGTTARGEDAGDGRPTPVGATT